MSLIPVNVICYVWNFLLKTAGNTEALNRKIWDLFVFITWRLVLYIWWIINTFIFLLSVRLLQVIMQFVNFKLLLQSLQSKTPELEYRNKKCLFFILNETLLRENLFICLSVGIMLYKDLSCKMGKIPDFCVSSLIFTFTWRNSGSTETVIFYTYLMPTAIFQPETWPECKFSIHHVDIMI